MALPFADILGFGVSTIGGILGRRKAKKAAKKERRAERAAAAQDQSPFPFETGGPTIGGGTRAMSLAGAATVRPGGGGDDWSDFWQNAGSGFPPDVNSDQAGRAARVINDVLEGAGDGAVRARARSLKVSKSTILKTLPYMVRSIFLTHGGGAAWTDIPQANKVMVSNEVERIFKTKRRPLIPKALTRVIKQVKAVRKLVGATRTLQMSSGFRKGRK